MKLLVTGGAGFIGSNFIHYWLSRHPGDQIINLDKLTYAGNLGSLEKISQNKNYKFVRGDITDQKLVNRLMAGIDWVVHFAAESHVDRSLNNPLVFLKTNILGTYTLLKASSNHKVKRFHHVSTDEVFGSLSPRSKRKFSERTKYDPRSPYSASKAASDHLVNSFHHSFGLPITITNCSNNYGPYQHPEKFIPRMITNLIRGEKIPIYGDGKYLRDWLYVEDHCRAIELILTRGKTAETYCLGGQIKQINNLELARLIIQLMGKDFKKSIAFVKDRPGHDRRYAVDWSKAGKELGWRPKYSLREGLKKTIEWYLKNPHWWDKLKKETEKFYTRTKKTCLPSYRRACLSADR
ncbi:MAG: dTDP-glucose 4,6-dehydratase [Patescibacteria group bacterium]|nr:dTDP-glucose 4,6-dehydratase [Patescibacteria group bacterium]